jgi:hypothetical protein
MSKKSRTNVATPPEKTSFSSGSFLIDSPSCPSSS